MDEKNSDQVLKPDKTDIHSPGAKARYPASNLTEAFPVEEVKKEVTCWTKCKNCLRGQSAWGDRNSQFVRLCGLCLANPKEQKWLVKFRKTGLRRLSAYLTTGTRLELQSKDIKFLIWSCLSLLLFFYVKKDETCLCFRTRNFERAKAVFRIALYMVLPEKQEEVIRAVIRFLTLTSQWNTEEYDSFVFQELLAIINKAELLIAKIIKQVELSQRDKQIGIAFEISCSLANILEHTHWDKYLFNHLLHNCFNTLLKVYILCNTPMSSPMKVANAKFRVIIKTSIKNFISNIRDNKGLVSVLDSLAKCLQDQSIPNEDRIDLVELVAFCAQKHSTKFYRESITPDLLDLLLHSIVSNEQLIVLSTHKIFHCLLDRHDNQKHFVEPVYFFKGKSNITVNTKYSVEDVHFFKNFSKTFIDGIYKCFLSFTDKYALTTCYLTLCLVLVEIPEPVITINIIHMLITLQNNVLNNNNLTMTIKSQIHAIIAAILSLICMVHDTEVTPLSKYVEEVVRFRTENSPHLLPPLQNKYTIPNHSAEYHEQLYFLENEVLYALQRCWLSRKTAGPK